MIKSVVVSLVALSIASVPVAAEARHRDNRDGNRSEQGQHRSRISTGEAIALGVGAFILGAAVSSKRTDDYIENDRWVDRRVYDREYNYHNRRQQERTCYKEFQPLYDSYGRIVQYAKITTCY